MKLGHTEIQPYKGPFPHLHPLAEWLVAQKVDRVLVAEGETLEGKGPVYVFGEAGVEILATSAATLSEALQECMR